MEAAEGREGGWREALEVLDMVVRYAPSSDTAVPNARC